MNDKIEITKKEYDQLKDDQRLLNCLRNAGVDNWEGYGFAMEAYVEDEDR